MLVIDESAANRLDCYEYFDGSLELLRELAVTSDVDAALPRLSAIVSKMLPHDALHIACFDQAGTTAGERVDRCFADVVGGSGVGDIVIDDLRLDRKRFRRTARRSGRSATFARSSADLTRAPEPMVRVAFWSKWPMAFDRSHLPLARQTLPPQPRSVPRRAGQGDSSPRRRSRAAGQRRGAARLEGLNAAHREGGESAEWCEVLHKATQVASTDTTVLIPGDSGTGKEVVARFIRAAAKRKTGPFVALNCAALPEQLLESELFGYERGVACQRAAGENRAGGAGALGRRAIPRRSRRGGLLFRTGEVPARASGARAPAGGGRILKANIRVIAATNRDLRKAVERGDFREDLFYRLGVFDIQTPVLRDRPADIVPQRDASSGDRRNRSAGPADRPDPRRQPRYYEYDWPGNVRELRNVLERAAILKRSAHRREPSEPAIRRPPIPRGTNRSERRRGHTIGQGPARFPRQQDEGSTAAWFVTHAASPCGDFESTDSRKLAPRNRLAAQREYVSAQPGSHPRRGRR